MIEPVVTAHGLEIVDITAPTAPVLTGTLYVPGHSSFVTTSGNTAYLASGRAGVHVVDIGEPANPALIGSLRLGDTVLGVAADRFFAYVVDGADGLAVTAAQCEN